MPADKKYVELIWADKYDKLEKGEAAPAERPNLPFQELQGKSIHYNKEVSKWNATVT